MKNILTLTLGVLLTLISGCVLSSKYPFYEDKQLIENPAIEGEWIGSFIMPGNPSYDIYSVSSDNSTDCAYILTFTDMEGKTGTFSLHLAKFEDIVIADIEPIRTPDNIDYDNPASILWCIRGHACVVVKDITPDEITLKCIPPRVWEDILKGYPIERTRVSDSTELGTQLVPTSDFQALIASNIDKPELWQEIKLLSRARYEAIASAMASYN